MEYEGFVAGAARVVELAGVAVLLVGALLAGGAFTRRLRRGGAFPAAYDALRADLGRAILLALELLVIADIIGTLVLDPTLPALAILAAIVAIRTFLSFVLELDVSGRWPWQRAHVTDRQEGSEA